MKIKTRLAVACTIALGGATALAIAYAQSSPPAPPGGMSGSQAPNTAGYDSTLNWAVNSGPQSSSITINFPSNNGGGGGGGTPPPPPPPQPVPIGNGVSIGVNNANSGVLANSTSGNYAMGRFGGDPAPLYAVLFGGAFTWAGQTVDVSMGRVPNSATNPTTSGSHSLPGSTCVRGVTPEDVTCTSIITIGGARWLFTVEGIGMLRADCSMPRPGGRPDCMLTGHASVQPAP